MVENRYEGKRVVITGGSSGLGLATAQLMVRGGAQVLITGRHQATLDAAAQALGGDVRVVRSDTASSTDIAALATLVHAELGGLDCLFANAGVTRFVGFEQTGEDVYDEVLRTNAKGPYFTVQKLAPLMPPGSSVVFTTSVADQAGIPAISAYAAAKAALRSMTRTLARELLPLQIRVNAVSPGPIDTGILESALPPDAADEARAQMTTDNPMQRFGQPAEVARAVAFLAFDATYTTGAELPVDGGGSQL